MPIGFSGDWETGWINLEDGGFLCDLLLSKDNRPTEFVINLRDTQGTLWKVEPDAIMLRTGIAVATPVTPYKYGVAVEGGQFHPLIGEN